MDVYCYDMTFSMLLTLCEGPPLQRESQGALMFSLILTYHFQIEINYILSSSCTFNVVCVYMYVYLHKRAYHFQIEINYILLSSCTFNVVCLYMYVYLHKGRIISK